jgi:sugar lactone lactonase YvrE
VADSLNETIREITPAGVVTTLAGSPGQFGSTDGTGANARFNDPTGLAVDLAGNVYVADAGNDTIRKIAPGGVVTTFAGTAGAPGSADGTGANARFNFPVSVAVDSAGNLYVADEGNSTIRKITPDGTVSTLAGTAGVTGSADGTGAAAQFTHPAGVAVDLAGNVYVADTFNAEIREITLAGVVTTIAGTAGMAGSANGTGSAAQFSLPGGIAVDNQGNIYVAEGLDMGNGNDDVREITPAGVVTTLAGSVDMIGSADGIGGGAQFNSPTSLAVNGWGDIAVADSGNDTIRELSIQSVPVQSGLTGTSAVPISLNVNGLPSGTPIYYRAAATSPAGAAVGGIQSFTPTPSPTPTPTPTPTPASTSPVTVTAVTVTQFKQGTKRHVTKVPALDVFFSGSLSATAAQNVAAYTAFSGKIKKVRKVSQLSFNTLVPITQAIYSPSTNSVLLVSRGKSSLPRFEQLHVNVSILTDPAGRPIYNGKNFTATVTNTGLVVTAG